MNKGRRYDGERKLNVKKVFAVIIAIAVIIMFIMGLNKLMHSDNSTKEKAVALKYFPVYTENKWGVIDSKGNIIIEPTYDEAIIIPDNTQGVFLCMNNVNYENNTYQIKALNEKNQEIFTDYELVEAIENHDSDNTLWYEAGILKVRKDGKYGIIDLKGNQLVSCIYDSIEVITGTSNSLVTVKDGKQGLIDNTGAVIIENNYQDIQAISDQYENGYIVQANGKYGVISLNKAVVLDTKYDRVKKVYGNSKYYVVEENGKLKIVDKDQKEYLVGEYDDITSINGEYAVVKKGNQYGVVSIADNKKAIDVKYEDIKYATGSNYIVKDNSKYGIMDIEGNKLVDFNYKTIAYRNKANFYEAIGSDYTSDLIDADMQVRLSGIVSEINEQAGYMRLRVGDEYQYYNFKFEEKKSQDILKGNTIFLSKKDGKYGFVDKNGIVVVDYIYDDAREQNDYGYASVKKDGLWGCVDSSGKVVMAPSYKLENSILIEFIGKWHLGEDLNLNYFTDK